MYIVYDNMPDRRQRVLYAITVDDLEDWLGRDSTEEEINTAIKWLDEYCSWTDAFELAFGPRAENQEVLDA